MYTAAVNPESKANSLIETEWELDGMKCWHLEILSPILKHDTSGKAFG